MIAKILAAALEYALRADWGIICTRLDAVCVLIERTPDRAPPLVAQRLLVSGEDHRHARHPGFDLIAIGRACWRRLSRRTHEGGSTIEQQIVRVLTGRYERSVPRKFREIALATLVARRYAKHRLPAAYLWIGYYGWRMNGYLQACRQLGLLPQSLSQHEAARLVARLKYPQPRKLSLRRVSQIERRAKHLRALYQIHTLDGPYRYLDGQILRKRSTSLEPLPQS
jgi:membrane peptidoglycan carboxypeptidase